MPNSITRYLYCPNKNFYNTLIKITQERKGHKVRRKIPEEGLWGFGLLDVSDGQRKDIDLSSVRLTEETTCQNS